MKDEKEHKTEEELIYILKGLQLTYEPNLKGREYYQKTLNQYPWNNKK